MEGEPGAQRAVVSCSRVSEIVPCQLVLVSVGMAVCPPMAAMRMDRKTGGVMNNQGRISDYPRIYVTGWLKRGPVGIIGTNIYDAKETAISVLQDKDALASANRIGIDDLFRDKMTGANIIFYYIKYCNVMLISIKSYSSVLDGLSSS